MEEWELKQMQSLPLEAKINRSIRRIWDAYDEKDGNLYLSRGGVDSTVVAWLIEKAGLKDYIPQISVGSLEPSENTKFNKSQGTEIIKAPMSQYDVIRKYGYPVGTKETAMKISRYSRTKSEEVKEKRLHGYQGKTRYIKDGMIPLKSQELIYAPYEISNECCIKRKEAAAKKYEKETGRIPITGEMASECRDRKKEYLKHGCLMFSKKRQKVTPIGFWTQQDVMKCVYVYDVAISEAYKSVEQLESGLFVFTGEQRTGCETCGFGIEYDTERYDRLKVNKPKVYDFMMNGGEWITKDRYRWVKFTPGGEKEWSNLYWVPSKEGYGYKFVLNYFFEVMTMEKRIS